jgi:hypothetical protein
MPCLGRRQREQDVASYHATEVFDNNEDRFSNPHVDSPYGWVGKDGSTTGLIYIHLRQQLPVSGIYHAGATVGNIGVTEFTVKYSKTTPPGLSTFVHSVHNNATRSNIFTSSGDDCKVEFSLFTTAYNATAFLVTPLGWKKSLSNVLDAAGMRVALEMCSS